MYNFAGIIINNDSKYLDTIYTYKIPEKMRDKIEIGHQVKVPFGRGNKVSEGFVIKLSEEADSSIKNIKEIISICSEFTLFRKEDIFLIEEMRKRCLCTYLECIKAIIPSAVIKNIKPRQKSNICINKQLSGKYLKPQYIEIFNFIKTNNGIYDKYELNKLYGFSVSSISTLIKNNFLSINKVYKESNDKKICSTTQIIKLNDAQENILKEILNSPDRTYLIHGVTGSGKTEIYLRLADAMMKNNKSSIILVPEISLTPQMIERFKQKFGENIAVFHSRLSDGEKFKEWLKVKENKVSIAIGARSAIFLPFNNLGLIVIDEEHELSYKSDSDPKYDTREVAEIKSRIDNCKVVLGSATPSVETYYKCSTGSVRLLEMKKRIYEKPMPEIQIVDMREELANNNRSIFSSKLYSGIKRSLANKEQIMLFINRRGYSPFVSCRKCGYVFKCKYCDVPLTYHAKQNVLFCHYCGRKYKAVKICPKCKSRYVKYFGVGTEKIEKEVNEMFPNAKTLRMDYDTTRTKNSFYEIYKSFKDGKADILIGTQMIAKGLDFKNVNLVGILAADLSLNIPDYRSAERTFELVTQASGRSGRGKKRGSVVVQTYSPSNYSILCAVNNDYRGFYNYEISLRERMKNPPFSRIFLINLSCKDEKRLVNAINSIKDNVVKIKNDCVEIFGPSPSAISFLKGNYRWRLILKGNMDEEYMLAVKNIVYKIIKNDYNDIRICLDINPSSFI